MTTTINIRIDAKTKNSAQKTLEAMGLDLSSGIKLFLAQVVTEQGIPFTPSKNAAKIRAGWDKEVAEALASGKGYKTGKELMDAVLA